MLKWALAALPAKNRLMQGDSKPLEEAFEKRFPELSSSDNETLNARATEVTGASSPNAADAEKGASSNEGAIEKIQSEGIDKSVLTLSTPKRHRNKEHLRFVMQQSCLLAAANRQMPITFGLCADAKATVPVNHLSRH